MTLEAALMWKHREIDAGIAAFTAAPHDPQPLAHAIRALRRHSADLPEGWVCRKARPVTRNAAR
jgi:hypothetical protein